MVANKNNGSSKGRLFIVATPIGNMSDITLRALEALKDANLIAAEDTRHTRKLLSHYGISKKRISYHDYNREESIKKILEELKKGKNVALATDAGTPGISDPGFNLIREAIKEGIEVLPIPGPSALTAALSAAGLPTDRFTFIGFLPAKSIPRKKLFSSLKDREETLIFFEPARRIKGTLADALEVLGDRNAVIAREMTKVHEELIRGKISELIRILADRALKGEITLLIEGAKRTQKEERKNELLTIVEKVIEVIADKELTGRAAVAKKLSKMLGLPRNAVYSILSRKGEPDK